MDKKEKIIRKYLKKLGRQPEEYRVINKKVKRTRNTLLGLIILYILYKTIIYHIYKWGAINLVLWIIIGGLAIEFLIWVIVFIGIDLKMYKRRQEVEKVFPDFLMLVASNINAGMTIDKAIMMASRPRFGALAEDIEEIAKKSFSGIEITQALREFGEKYGSPIIKRSMALIIRGIETGGRVADLINKLAVDIQENRTLKKEMAANVTTYTIFIAAATLVGAPLLFGLATQLIRVMASIMGNLDISNTTGLMFHPSKDTINIKDFKIYVYVLLISMSIISASMISIIKHGTVKKGWKNIFVFMIVTIAMYLLANLFLSGLFSSMLQ